MKLASGAFQDREMSVAVGDTLESEGQPPESIVDGMAGYSLVAFTTQVARDEEQIVCRDPVDGQAAHGLVVGKKTGSRQRALARASQWVVAPDNACYPPAA